MIVKLIELFNEVSQIQIIPAYTEFSPPEKPYATYQIISKTSKDFGRATHFNKENSSETATYREECTVQFDVYEKREDNFKYCRKLLELIIFILRKEYSFLKVGVKNYSKIEFLQEEIQNKYEYRGMFEVTFEYMNITDERKVEFAETIEYLVNEYKGVIVDEWL